MPARPARLVAALLAACTLAGCDDGTTPTTPDARPAPAPTGAAAAPDPGAPLTDEQREAIEAFIEEAEAAIRASEGKLQGVQMVAGQLNDNILNTIAEMWNERLLKAREDLDALRNAGSNNAEHLKAEVQYALAEAESIDAKAVERLKALRTPGN